jgi:hypothetical protein
MINTYSGAAGASLKTVWKSLEAVLAKASYQADNNTRQPTLFGHSLITGGLVTINLAAFLMLSGFAAQKANDWLTLQKPTQTLEVNDKVIPPLLQNRLRHQVAEIDARQARHAKVMTYFYKQYFVALSMASGSALAAILFAFFISRDGWDKANNGLINAFFVTFSAATLYTQIPGLFAQKANLEQNRELYIAYTNLRNQVVNYMVIGEVIDLESEELVPVEPGLFIYQIDQQLVELNQLPVNFDATQSIKPPELPQLDLPVSPAAPAAPSES